MTIQTSLGRRGFLGQRRRRCRRLLARLFRSLRGGARRRGEGDQRLGGDPAGRQGGDPHRPLRNGPGHAHRPRPARRRGAGVRLEQGHLGISDARREPEAQPRLEELLDRRQPRHPREQPVCPRGRRHGARDADRGGGGPVEGAGERMQRGQQRHHPQVGQEAHLRRGCRRGGPARAAQGSEAEGSQGLEDRRQAGEAPRHARQGHRQADLRHRLHDARHAGRDRARLPGDRRQAQELRRCQGREDAGREEGRGDRRQRRRRRGRHLLERPHRARRPAGRVGCRQAGRGPERDHHGDAEGRSRRLRSLRRQQGG